QRPHPGHPRRPDRQAPLDHDRAGLAARRPADHPALVRRPGAGGLRRPRAARGLRDHGARGAVRMMRGLTHLAGARFTILVALVLIALGGDERTVGLVALAGNAMSHALVKVLKRTVARPRPCDAWGVPLALIELPDPFSFPSGHSAASFAV